MAKMMREILTIGAMAYDVIALIRANAQQCSGNGPQSQAKERSAVIAPS